MEKLSSKSYWTLILHQENAQPWDDFIMDTDTSATADNDMK